MSNKRGAALPENTIGAIGHTVSAPKALLAVLGGFLTLVFAQTIAILIAEVAGMLGVPTYIRGGVSAVLYPLLTIPGVWLICKVLFKLPISGSRLTRPQFALFWTAAAFIMPMLVCVALILTPGEFYSNLPHLTTERAAAFAVEGILFYGLAVGFVEELIFRGVIMSALEYRWGKTAAILIPSVLFGAVHIMGRQLDLLSIIQLLIAGSVVGILFSLVTYQTGSIWSSALMHAVWNMFMCTGVFTLSAERSDMSIFGYDLQSKSFLITGGDFGVEASIAAIAAYSIFITAAVILLRRDRKNTSEELSYLNTEVSNEK